MPWTLIKVREKSSKVMHHAANVLLRSCISFSLLFYLSKLVVSKSLKWSLLAVPVDFIIWGGLLKCFFYINYKMIYWILCKKFVIFLYKFLGSQIVVFLIPKFRDYRNLHQNNYEQYMYRFSYLLCLQPSKVFWWEQWWEFKQRIPKFR